MDRLTPGDPSTACACGHLVGEHLDDRQDWTACGQCGCLGFQLPPEGIAAIPCPPDYTLPEDDTSITRKHFLDPDPYDSTSCQVCGRADGWGVLHLPETPEFDVDDDFGKAPRCDSCPHFQHRSACDVVVSRWPVRLCPCGGERRDAVA